MSIEALNQANIAQDAALSSFSHTPVSALPASTACTARSLLAIDTTATDVAPLETVKPASALKMRLGRLLRRVSIKSPASSQPIREADAPLQPLTASEANTLGDVPKPQLAVRNSIDIARAKLIALAHIKNKQKRDSAQSSVSTLSTASSNMTAVIYEAGQTEGVRASVLEEEEQVAAAEEEDGDATPKMARSHSVRFKELEKRKRSTSVVAIEDGESPSHAGSQGRSTPTPVCDIPRSVHAATMPSAPQNTPAGQDGIAMPQTGATKE